MSLPVHRGKPSVSVISDNTLIREGLCAVFRRHAWRVDSHTADTALRLPPSADLVVLDLESVPTGGRIGSTKLRASLNGTPILLYGSREVIRRRRWLTRCGVVGSLSGDESPNEIVRLANRLVNAADAIMDIENVLSAREREVFRLLGEGKSNRQIAHELGVSVKTVETHKEHLKQKLNMPTTADLLELAIRLSGG